MPRRRRGGPGRQSRLNLSMISFSCASFCAVMRFFGEPDGRENPFTYFWSAYVKKGAKDNRCGRYFLMQF